MALQRAAFSGKENVLQGFDMAMDGRYSAYSVWYGLKDKAFEWNSPDREGGAFYFQQHVEALLQNDNTDLYLLKVHPDPVTGVFSYKSDIVCCIPFRVCNLDVTNQITGVRDNSSYSVLKDIETRLAAIEQPQEAEPDGFERIIGQVNGLLQNEAVVGLVNNVLTKILSAFLPNQPKAVTSFQPHSINGIDMPNETTQNKDLTETQLAGMNEALTRLQNYCDLGTDLTLLANMAEKNPVMFKMLLMQLRS